MKLSKVALRFGAILIFFVFVAWVLLQFFPKKQQHHLSITHSFGIGFDLNPSYATVAVSYPDGSVLPIGRVEGDAAYRDMMLRLSLPSSQHIHQPHRNVGESIDDLPRQLWRNFLKRLGLPASRDVGILSRVIQALRDQASSFVGEPVSAATISIPHLAALYGEDICDAFEYISLIYLAFYPYIYQEPIPATIAAYAGNGLGLCRDYKDVEACKEEEENMPLQYGLAMSYTHTSLITSHIRIMDAYHLEEIHTVEDLRLGYDTKHQVRYWETIRDALEFPLVSPPLRENTLVLVLGDTAEKPGFRKVLEQVITDVIGGRPEIVDQDPEFSAAKGAAELAKRAIFKQTLPESDTVDDL